MPVIQSLHDNLTKQVEVYRELKELADHKQKALVANNLQELEAVTVREEQLLVDASRLEKERLLWADQMSEMVGKSAEEITLTELAVKYPQLKDVNQELKTVVTGLMDVHEVNTQLLKQALGILDFTVNLLTYREGTTYGKPGQNEKAETHLIRLIDRSI